MPPQHQQPRHVYVAQQHTNSGQPFAQPTSNGILGVALIYYASQQTTLPSAFSTMSLQDPTWNMDTGATSHLNSNARNLSTTFNKCLFSSIHVGDGNLIPVTNTGHSIISSYQRPLHLHNVLVTPYHIKDLISVRQFTRDNYYTIKFDAFGFSVKYFLTRHILLQCDSSGDLYPVTKPSTLLAAFVSTSSTTWQQRLGHPGDEVLRSLSYHQFISCNIEKSTHVCHACQFDPNWCNAMYDDYNALVKNGTWILVPRLTDANLARLVANDSSQQLDVDFDETFSLVVKPATIRTVLTLVVSRQWPIHQLDVKNAFLNGDLSETVYMHQLPGFVDTRYPNHKKYALQLVEHAHMSCRGLQYLTFTCPDLSYAVQQVCLYMHDLREPHFAALKRILRYVQGTLELGLHLYAFATTSLVGYTDADWAGCPSTRRSTSGYYVFLDDNLFSWSAKRQHTISRSIAKAEYRGVANVVAKTTWIRNLLRELHSPLLIATLVYCNNVSVVYMSANPVQHQRTKHIKIDIHFVRDMVKAVNVRVLYVFSRYQYADIFTKCLPSALFEDFRSISQFLHAPTIEHFQSVKRILRYVKGTISFGLTFSRPQTNTITGYSDADWARCLDTRRSTYGYSIYLGGNLVSWSAKKQPTVSRSSCESEYQAMANTAAEIVWITHLLRELHALPPDRPTLLCDNKSALFMTQNPVSHKRAKHIDLDYHFIRELVNSGKLYTKFVPTNLQKSRGKSYAYSWCDFSSSNVIMTHGKLLFFPAATVASQWLELLHQDIQGRLAALKRSKKRVRDATEIELPFLISSELSSNQENDSSAVHITNKANTDMHKLRWTSLFDQMDKSLLEEEKNLENSLNQVRQMLLHCENGLQFPTANCLQHVFPRAEPVLDKDLAVRAAAAAIYSTSNFLQQAKTNPVSDHF
nr:ribonuclease H-like domain-containing protein [Tanacetum cinerariifolium]